MRGLLVAAVIGGLLLAGPAQAQGRLQRLNPFNRGSANPPPTTTFMPSRGFEEWVANNLDIRSFNSSLDSRRETYQARFREVGYEIQPRRGRGPVTISLGSPDGDITLSVFQRGDFNRDGIEDVFVCLEDSLRNGRYHRTQALLAQKYTSSGPLVALDVQVSDPRCREG